MKTIGTVTIGQSPRTDVVPEIETILDNSLDSRFSITEKGALDGLQEREIKKLSPGPNEKTLVSRMRDGSEVKVAKRKIHSLMKEKIQELNNEDVYMIILLCSGSFPTFESEVPLIYPHKLLLSTVDSLSFSGNLGILIPSENQMEEIRGEFGNLGQVELVACSPYRRKNEDIRKAARELRDRHPGLIILNCFGYGAEMKKSVAHLTEVPTVAVRSLSAHFLAEFLS